jgi:hypothetical protein
MKRRVSILFLSTLLLLSGSFLQVIQKLMDDNHYTIELVNDGNDDAEENTQKTSEENARETDLDEDPFSIDESIVISSDGSLFSLKNADYSFGQVGYFPEIVSPPPQA